MAASGKTNLTTPIIILVVLVVAAWFAFKPSGDSAGWKDSPSSNENWSA